MRQGIRIDESRVLQAHRNVFGIGLASYLDLKKLEPIPEEMFLEALA